MAVVFLNVDRVEMIFLDSCLSEFLNRTTKYTNQDEQRRK